MVCNSVLVWYVNPGDSGLFNCGYHHRQALEQPMRTFKAHRFFLMRHFSLLFSRMRFFPALKAAAHKGSELEIVLQCTFVKQLLNLSMNFPSRCLLSLLFRKFFWKNIWVEEGMKQGCPCVPHRGGGRSKSLPAFSQVLALPSAILRLALLTTIPRNLGSSSPTWSAQILGSHGVLLWVSFGGIHHCTLDLNIKLGCKSQLSGQLTVVELTYLAVGSQSWLE